MDGLPGVVMNRDNMMGLHRRTIRSEINPMDKATIFSIYPKNIPVRHETTQPSDYLIPKGTIENPGRLVVGTASWWLDKDPETPLLEIKVSSLQVADSIVKDHIKARIGVGPNAHPGLFYMPGDISVKELQSKYPHLLIEAERKQRAWYEEIIKQSDIDWARSNGNPLAIDDTARLGCEALGYTRDWMTRYRAAELVKCVACGELRNPQFPICGKCHAIVDKKRAEELGLVFAK